jgi:hypothetical protein
MHRMQPLPLHAHPATPCAALSRLDVTVAFTPGRSLELDYALHGDLAALRVPPPAAALRTDGLWQHTCCEIFLREPGSARYYEWNLAPSGAWAFYAFDGYRASLPAVVVPLPPAIYWHYTTHEAHLRARLTLEGLPLAAATGLQAAISAVIETAAASPAIAYWALKHPPGKPDFHHSDNFVLTL